MRTSVSTSQLDNLCVPSLWSDLVIQEADGQDVLGLRHPISHGQVSQRVSQQQHVGSTLQLPEACCVRQSALPLVEGMDELAFEGLQDPLIRH